MTNRSSRRLRFVGLTLVTIVLGLLVQRGAVGIDGAARDKLGDALWAMMMTWGISALVPSASLVVRGAAAMMVCAVVEFSQLISTPALDALRATTFGRLVLGSGFDATDLVAYAGGVLAAMLVERGWRRGASAAPRSGNR